jgi:hypothetical protein
MAMLDRVLDVRERLEVVAGENIRPVTLEAHIGFYGCNDVL